MNPVCAPSRLRGASSFCGALLLLVGLGWTATGPAPARAAVRAEDGGVSGSDRIHPDEHLHEVASTRVRAAGSLPFAAITAIIAAPQQPVTNIDLRAGYPSACVRSGTSPECVTDALGDLNYARSVMGQPGYSVPDNFASLSAAEQLLILSNDDRALYGLTPIRGLNVEIGDAAAVGVRTSDDPRGVGLAQAGFTAWTSNWGAGYASAPYIYYAFMYADGPHSSNVDCPSRDSAGCWGHRASVLYDFGSAAQVIMGFASGPSAAYSDRPSIAVIYEGFPSGADIAVVN